MVKPAEDHFTHCFNVVLKDYELGDTAFSYSKISKKMRTESDVKEACRNAVKEIKTEFKIRHCHGRCPVSDLELTLDNAVVHHYNMFMNEVIEEWVKSKGGYEVVHQFVNPTIGGGTVTCFQDDEVTQDFIIYHNAHTHLVVLHKIGHNMVHNKNKCFNKEQEEKAKKYQSFLRNRKFML